MAVNRSLFLEPHAHAFPLSFSQVTLARHQLFAFSATCHERDRNKAFETAILSDHRLEDTKTLQQTKPSLDEPKSQNGEDGETCQKAPRRLVLDVSRLALEG